MCCAERRKSSWRSANIPLSSATAGRCSCHYDISSSFFVLCWLEFLTPYLFPVVTTFVCLSSQNVTRLSVFQMWLLPAYTYCSLAVHICRSSNVSHNILQRKQITQCPHWFGIHGPQARTLALGNILKYLAWLQWSWICYTECFPCSGMLSLLLWGSE